MRRVAWWILVVGLAAPALVVRQRERAASRAEVVVYSPEQDGVAVVVPRRASPEERRAAELIRSTLAKAAGRPESAFPLAVEGRGVPRRAVLVGDTQRGRGFLASPPRPPFDTAVGFAVRGGAVSLRSERRESIEAAAGWFLAQQTGAQWFIPGPLGEVVPRRAQLILPGGEETARPGFVHRDLQATGPGAREWYGRNGLESRIEHGHNLVGIFRPGDFWRRPEMAPMRGGQRFIPAAGDQNWQPNFLSGAAVAHAAAVAVRAFDANPGRISYSLSTNDAVRYDDSAETLAAVAPPRFFRHRPDYSNLVFGFTNAVAERVARHHPDRLLPAYAYYWCENTPDFPVARNVVPVLTADRTRWSFPEFAAEDRALIERWCRSGAEMVALYDYYYGAPFLVPRPTIYAVKEVLPFAHRAGVRGFYAEMNPNWALDGPKPWLAAQLLWSPERNPDELLETYYREFWAEAAEPMQRYFALCEQVWREQPGPPLWLRYFQDEDQAFIFSAAQRAELRMHLVAAGQLARTEPTRARVAMASAGFAVTEAFAEFCGARQRVSWMTREPVDPRALFAAWKSYREARATFTARYADIRREQPLALAAQELEHFLRNQPDGRAAQALARTDAGRAVLRESDYLPWVYLRASEPEITGVLTRGIETLADPEWRQVVARPVGSSATIDWTEPNASWRGSGEPWEGRSVLFASEANGARRLRMQGCRTEGIGQWQVATPGALYAAQVNVRAKSSPGTATFLIVSFLDESHRHLGLGHVDRLPAAAAEQETGLCVIVRAPDKARFVGFAVRVLNQINDDFAEFSGASLRRLAP